jgi:uncharacterized small protein (TIGR04563 family)
MSDKRKMSIYLPEALLATLNEEAARQDRSVSWVVQQALKIAFPTIKQFPTAP